MKAKAQTLLTDTKAAVDGRRDSDTIRLWESYRDQALMWRALTLLQIPATFLALILAFVLYVTHETKVIAPREATAGLLSLKEIPDAEYFDFAQEYINLVASYQPAIARRQFTAARELLTEPMLGVFDNEILQGELRAIESTSRTQTFFVDPTKTKIERFDTEVAVTFVGDRLKFVAGKELPLNRSTYIIRMKVLPRNKLNPLGLAITSVKFENQD